MQSRAHSCLTTCGKESAQRLRWHPPMARHPWYLASMRVISRAARRGWGRVTEWRTSPVLKRYRFMIMRSDCADNLDQVVFKSGYVHRSEVIIWNTWFGVGRHAAGGGGKRNERCRVIEKVSSCCHRDERNDTPGLQQYKSFHSNYISEEASSNAKHHIWIIFQKKR